MYGSMCQFRTTILIIFCEYILLWWYCMNGLKILHLINTQMHAHNVAIYSKDMNIFHLNVLTNNHKEQRQTILFLHGYLGSAQDYIPFYAKFEETYNILAIDLRGHGDSESPKGRWTMDDMVDDVYQIVRLMVPDSKKMIIVGNSLSTAITLKFTSEYPDLVKNIFLISPTAKFHLPLIGRFAIQFMRIIPNKLIASSMRWVDRSIDRHVKSGAKNEFAHMAMQKLIHVPVSAHKKILRTTLPSYKIDPKEINIPMMIIAGEDDTTVRFNDSVELNSTAENSSILMLKNTKHRILVTRTNLVLEIFEQWVHTQSELLTDVKHYHETDLITDDDGHRMLPEDWITSDCGLKH